ncbi:MAG: c-type cytochrome [Candidatus Krumholzibacteriia bacterium]
MTSEGASSAAAANPDNSRGMPGPLGRLWIWIDQRTGVDRMLRQSLDEPIPGGARFAYVFGSALLFLFVSQTVTGVSLALYYAATPMTAHASVAYIIKEVAAGAFLRSLHSYGSSAMVVVLLLHFLQTFLYGSYKGKRELLWISGCTLSLLVLGMAFTGYLLSWDQNAFGAGSVGTDLIGQVPVIGESLRELVRGGAKMGALTLSRFYVLHILIIPALIISFIAIHMVLFRKAGAAGPPSEDPVTPHLPAELFYPKQVLIDMAFVLVVMGLLGMLAHFVPVTLGPEANPENTQYLPRPEWFYLPMFQWLKYWEGWRTVIGVFVIPALLVGLVFVLPFVDRGLERRPWRRPIPVGGVLIVLMGCVWLGMTSRLEDSRNPIVAAQLAQQAQEEEVYFYAAFQPYSGVSPPAAAASPALDATAAQGKGIFDSHGCTGCHGASGGGATGPALTHIASQYPPAQLAALLKAPTARMKAAGMVPLTLNADEMNGLVSYLASLGGTSVASAAVPPAAGAITPPPATEAPDTTAATPKAGPGSLAGGPSAAQGKGIFDSHGCSGCHGASGGGGVGPTLTHISSQYPPAQLTALLKAPTAKMRAAGMVPLTLNAADMKALVSYVSSLGGTSAAAPATPPASSGPAAPAPATATTGATAASTKTPQAPAAPVTGTVKPAQPPSAPQAEPARAGGDQASAGPSALAGEAVFKAQGCPSCHGAGGIGTGRAPALTTIGKTASAAELTSVLQHPTDKMRAGGMPPVTATGTDLRALVAYLKSLGSSAPAPPAATTRSPGAPSSMVSPAASPQGAEIASLPPMNDLESKGQAIFIAHQCAGCHGTGGAGGTAAAPALAGAGARLAPAPVTAMLRHPTARMQLGGMPPISLNGDELKALAAYVGYISRSNGNPPGQ